MSFRIEPAAIIISLALIQPAHASQTAAAAWRPIQPGEASAAQPAATSPTNGPSPTSSAPAPDATPHDAPERTHRKPPDRSAAMAADEKTGLGITGAQTPQALKDIAAAPYAVPSPVDCAETAIEIGDLDVLLGPDVDILADPKARDSLERQTGQALSSALIGVIPYRWVLRLMTQASRGDRDLRLAILAGTARRGFLKGLRQGLACDPPIQTVAP